MPSTNHRRPGSEDDLRSWLENMVWYHHFGDEEIIAATGLTYTEVSQARSDFMITVNNRPPRPADAPLLVLPYPGGRHPRVQLQEKALNPQRDTKVSIFAPWDPSSYAVLDLPEALSCNLGLLYLAHSYEPTLWTRMGVPLEPLEWRRLEKGALEMERTLPNGVRFGARVTPTREAAQLEFWVVNGTEKPLTGLRPRICTLLKGLSGFEHLTNDNKQFPSPFAACRSSQPNRWVLTAWERPQKLWGDPSCPCLHADPHLPECAPGETQRVRGWLSFYEGSDTTSEIRRISTSGWLRPE